LKIILIKNYSNKMSELICSFKNHINSKITWEREERITTHLYKKIYFNIQKRHSTRVIGISRT